MFRQHIIDLRQQQSLRGFLPSVLGAATAIVRWFQPARPLCSITAPSPVMKMLFLDGQDPLQMVFDGGTNPPNRSYSNSTFGKSSCWPVCRIHQLKASKRGWDLLAKCCPVVDQFWPEVSDDWWHGRGPFSLSQRC